MERRFQIFVSSTQTDLREERKLVIEKLLSAGHIPVGMELFNSGDDTWATIERLIRECDYYVVIVKARYGTARPGSPLGCSYTEEEYGLARELGRPRLAFIHANPGKFTTDVDQASEAAQKLVRFRQKLRDDKICVDWDSNAGLVAAVLNGVTERIKREPQPGWIRADSPEAIPIRLRTDILEPSVTLGISRISVDGQAGPTMSQNLAAAKEIAIMSTSAIRVIDIQKPHIIEAVATGCQVRVLVPEEASDFLRDVEESEAQYAKRPPIAREVRDLRERLREIVGEAKQRCEDKGGEAELGRVRMGYFTTHLRSTMILRDESWGWLTLTLPPLRAPETASLELSGAGPRSLLRACKRHFDRTWSLVEARSRVVEVRP